MYNSKSFDFYLPCMTENAGLLRKIHRDLRSKPPIAAVSVAMETAPQLWSCLDSVIMSNEYLWMRDGNNVLFPAAPDLWDRLVKARYDRGSLSLLDLPERSFVAAMPTGVMIREGLPAPSYLFVRCRNFAERAELCMKFWRDVTAANKPNLNVEKGGIPEHEETVTMIYRDTVRNDKWLGPHGPLNMLMAPLTWLSDLIDPDLSESGFAELIEKVAPRTAANLMEDAEYDAAVRVYGLRLYAGMLVYNAATEGKFFREGLPAGFTGKPVMKGFKKEINYKFSGLGRAQEFGESMVVGEKTAHPRKWFFRNLKSDRYYKGEWEGKALGSRWVYVSDTMVKGRALTARDVSV